MPALPTNAYLSWAKEVTWGVNPGVGALTPVSFVSEAFKVAINKKVLVGVQAGREKSRQVALARKAAGPLKFEVDVESGIGMLLKSLLVTEGTVDGGVGNGATHAFTPGATTGTGLTALVNRDTSGVVASGANTNLWAFTGGKVKKLVFSAKEDETLQVEADVVFKDGNPGATGATPVYTTQLPLVYHTGTFTIDGTAIPCKEFEITIDGGIMDSRGKLGSNLIQEPQPGLFDCVGSMSLYFDDMVQVMKYLNNTQAAIILNLTGAAVGVNTRGLKFEIPAAFFNGETPAIEGATPEVMQKIPWAGVKTGTGNPNNLVKVTLTNSQRTAY